MYSRNKHIFNKGEYIGFTHHGQITYCPKCKNIDCCGTKIKTKTTYTEILQTFDMADHVYNTNNPFDILTDLAEKGLIKSIADPSTVDKMFEVVDIGWFNKVPTEYMKRKSKIESKILELEEVLAQLRGEDEYH